MTTQAVTVRRAGISDGPALALLRRRWAAEDEAVGDPFFDERFTSWFGREAQHRLVWVAERSGQAVGMINVTVFVRMPRPGRPEQCWGYIANAFVLPAHRNAGVGSAMLDAAVAHARDHGSCGWWSTPVSGAFPSTGGPGSGPRACCSLTWRHDLRSSDGRRLWIGLMLWLRWNTFSGS
jgi:GNAT superfamily N-acetyltransferase